MNRQYGALSGVAIALIVLNHAIHFGLQISPPEGGLLGGLIVLQAFGAFAVPAFLFISGAFLSYSAGQLSLQFTRANLGRILWPYLIWSSIFYVLVFQTNDERYSIAGYVKNLLVGYPYHFVPLLIFWYLAAPLLVRLGKRQGALVLAGIGVYQAILLAARYPEMFGMWGVPPQWIDLVKLPVLFTSMADWAIYFPLGLVLGMHDAAVKPYLIRLRWPAAAAATVLFLLGILNAFDVISAPWARFAAPVPLMFLLPIVSRGSIPAVRRLEFLGKRSYGIYLAHFVAINLAASLAGPLTVGGGGLLLLIATFLALALASPLVLMDVMARPAAARRVYRYVFGISPPPPDVRQPLRGRLPVAVQN